MKKIFTPQQIRANRGCYSPEQVDELSFIKNKEITLVQIMESEISIRDKRWFLFNKAELTLDQKKELAFLMAKSVSEIFNKRYPNDNRVNECLETIQQFKEGKITREQLMDKRRAAYAAAYAADAAADAAYAAYAAAYAADAAAYAADAAYAAYAAAYAADAADAAAYAAAAAADDALTYSQKLQIILIEFINQQA